MMNPQENKKPKSNRWKQAVSHAVSRDPFVDWALIVSFSTLAALVLIILGVFSFIDMDERLSETAEVAKSSKKEIVDKRSLEQVIDEYDGRAKERAALLNGYDGPSDPSI